jgi:uncharacterized protein
MEAVSTRLRLRVAAPPEGGRANDAVVRVLAKALSVPRDAITVVSGRGARDKVVELTGLDSALVEQRLSSAAGSGPST